MLMPNFPSLVRDGSGEPFEGILAWQKEGNFSGQIRRNVRKIYGERSLEWALRAPRAIVSKGFAVLHQIILRFLMERVLEWSVCSNGAFDSTRVSAMFVKFKLHRPCFPFSLFPERSLLTISLMLCLSAMIHLTSATSG